jgi:hypothetical protein
VQNLERFGEAEVEVVIQDETVLINGLAWRHRLIARYYATDLSAPLKGELTSWRDIYDHRIDSAHILRRLGRYDAMVVSDPEWINSRRELTRKLVEAVRIERVTQAEVDAAVAEHARRRAIDKKCGADMKCRARAVEGF